MYVQTADYLSVALDRKGLTVLCLSSLQMLRGPLRKFFPVANNEMTKAATCMFTTTQDRHFIVDLHPKHQQVIAN